MEGWTRVAVPRRLRVRTSVALGGQRVPLRMLGLLLTLLILWGLLSLAGADLAATAYRLGAVGLLAGLAIEGRWGGFTSAQVVRQVVRYYRGRRVLVVTPLTVVLTPEPERITPVRAPRWQVGREEPRP